MSNPDLILTLGKVIVAAAWADGEITPDEINSLKDLTFRLPEITARQWAELEMYIETPVEEAERARLIEELRQMVSSRDDKKLALQALDDLVNADGVVTEAEQAVVNEVKTALDNSAIGVLGGFSKFVGSLLQRREQALRDAPNREEHFEDYIQNKVYYKLQQRLHKENVDLNIPEEDLRKLCLSGGIMAQIARIQPDIDGGEFAVIVKALRAGWDINQDEAAFVAEVAISDAATSFDKLRLSREFLKVCTPQECEQFVKILFQIAAADGEISAEEVDHIRKISKELLLSNKQFAQAKRSMATA